MLIGGLVFIASVLGAGLAGSFPVLLAAFVIFFPASGAFVSLTQSALMDAYPDRRARHMARWTLAGAIGSVGGPLLVAAVVAAGGSWRVAFVLVAGAGAVSWLAIAATGPGADGAAVPDPEDEVTGSWPGLRSALRLTRQAGAVRWLLLIETSDLLLDVLTGFLALYLVAALHASAFVAALGVAVRLGAGLAGYALLNPLLERFSPLRVLRASVLVSAVLFPAFLLAPGIAAKLVLLAALSIATAPWYPVLMAELYSSLPDRSGLVVSLSSAAALAGAAGPLVVGLLAEQIGLPWAMAVLCVVPLIMLAAPARARQQEGTGGSAKLGCRD